LKENFEKVETPISEFIEDQESEQPPDPCHTVDCRSQPELEIKLLYDKLEKLLAPDSDSSTKSRSRLSFKN
jgi:hypothetical protein